VPLAVLCLRGLLVPRHVFLAGGACACLAVLGLPLVGLLDEQDFHLAKKVAYTQGLDQH
jgi:hypothetical protein